MTDVTGFLLERERVVNGIRGRSELREELMKVRFNAVYGGDVG